MFQLCAYESRVSNPELEMHTRQHDPSSIEYGVFLWILNSLFLAEVLLASMYTMLCKYQSFM